MWQAAESSNNASASGVHGVESEFEGEENQDYLPK